MNERLRTVMLRQGVSVEALAQTCSVDPKTVGRWITTCRVPHRQHRWATSKLLGADEVYLWPELLDRKQKQSADIVRSELVQTYPDRASIPRDTWTQLLGKATGNVDVLAYSGTFLSQTPKIATMFAERAGAGARIRLCFADPTSQAVDTRDREEGLRGTLAAKIRAALTYYEDLVDMPGCQIRLHSTTVYASLFRYDNDLIVNPHAWGQPASANPAMHLRRLDVTGWFDHYMTSFDSVWQTAEPWHPEGR